MTGAPPALDEDADAGGTSQTPDCKTPSNESDLLEDDMGRGRKRSGNFPHRGILFEGIRFTCEKKAAIGSVELDFVLLDKPRGAESFAVEAPSAIETVANQDLLDDFIGGCSAVRFERGANHFSHGV